jgi:hypothetical protein
VQAVLTAAHALGSLVRLTVLALLFAPLLLTAHLALQFNVGRPLWLRLLRCKADDHLQWAPLMLAAESCQ